MPEVGEVKRGKDLGRKGSGHYQKYIWCACTICGKERWVEFHNGKPDNLRCISCSSKANGALRNTTREHNPNWKGGIGKHPMGYIIIYCPEHPYAYSTGYIPRSRLILEQSLGRYLYDSCVPHHINGDKTDDRPENLEELLANVHLRNHANERRDARGRFKANH